MDMYRHASKKRCLLKLYMRRLVGDCMADVEHVHDTPHSYKIVQHVVVSEPWEPVMPTILQHKSESESRVRAKTGHAVHAVIQEAVRLVGIALVYAVSFVQPHLRFFGSSICGGSNVHIHATSFARRMCVDPFEHTSLGKSTPHMMLFLELQGPERLLCGKCQQCLEQLRQLALAALAATEPPRPCSLLLAKKNVFAPRQEARLCALLMDLLKT
eukprot:1156703-Pelagomonas_calceolata.AAC.8